MPFDPKLFLISSDRKIQEATIYSSLPGWAQSTQARIHEDIQAIRERMPILLEFLKAKGTFFSFSQGNIYEIFEPFFMEMAASKMGDEQKTNSRSENPRASSYHSGNLTAIAFDATLPVDIRTLIQGSMILDRPNLTAHEATHLGDLKKASFFDEGGVRQKTDEREAGKISTSEMFLRLIAFDRALYPAGLAHHTEKCITERYGSDYAILPIEALPRAVENWISNPAFMQASPIASAFVSQIFSLNLELKISHNNRGKRDLNRVLRNFKLSPELEQSYQDYELMLAMTRSPYSDNEEKLFSNKQIVSIEKAIKERKEEIEASFLEFIC